MCVDIYYNIRNIQMWSTHQVSFRSRFHLCIHVEDLLQDLRNSCARAYQILHFDIVISFGPPYVAFWAVLMKKYRWCNTNRQTFDMSYTLIGNKSWVFKCCWNIAGRCCSNYIFILDLTHRFIGLGKGNCKTRREAFLFWDLVHRISEVWR